MCPPYYVAFWLPLEGRIGIGRVGPRARFSNGWRPGRAQRQWSRQSFPVSSTMRNY